MTTFWKRVEKKLSELNISEADLSRLIDVTQASITGWKSRDSIPRADVALKTARVLKTSVEYLISGNLVSENTDKIENSIVPILNQEMSAGHGDILPDTDVVDGLLSLPLWLRKRFGNNLAALFVHGDSMTPTLSDGDMIVCDSLGWDNSDGIYAIRMNGNGYVKRIQVGNGKILIKSDNPSYETIEEPLDSDCIQIIGKVRLVVHSV